MFHSNTSRIVNIVLFWCCRLTSPILLLALAKVSHTGQHAPSVVMNFSQLVNSLHWTSSQMATPLSQTQTRHGSGFQMSSWWWTWSSTVQLSPFFSLAPEVESDHMFTTCNCHHGDGFQIFTQWCWWWVCVQAHGATPPLWGLCVLTAVQVLTDHIPTHRGAQLTHTHPTWFWVPDVVISIDFSIFCAGVWNKHAFLTSLSLEIHKTFNMYCWMLRSIARCRRCVLHVASLKFNSLLLRCRQFTSQVVSWHLASV